ncbi:MAG TPA: VOC family protein [Candidatus Saccharimonadales bacterium]|nr:VOC family protein [Candidatus Saccharimonadales bacterium]
MSNRVVHFEIEAKDKDRAKKFYSDAFGWKMDQAGEDFGGYISVTTGDIKVPGGINGGIYQEEEKKLNAFSCVISVDNVDKAIADVKSAGGKVFDDNKTPDGKQLGEKMDIPGIGIYVKCEDTEGNRFTLLQPSPDMMQQK